MNGWFRMTSWSLKQGICKHTSRDSFSDCWTWRNQEPCTVSVLPSSILYMLFLSISARCTSSWKTDWYQSVLYKLLQTIALRLGMYVLAVKFVSRLTDSSSRLTPPTIEEDAKKEEHEHHHGYRPLCSSSIVDVLLASVLAISWCCNCRASLEHLLMPCLVSKKIPTISVTLNLRKHVWSIKYRWKNN